MLTQTQAHDLMTRIDMWGFLVWQAAWGPEQSRYPQLQAGVPADEITQARHDWVTMLDDHVEAGELTRAEADRLTSLAETWGTTRADEGRAGGNADAGKHAAVFSLELEDVGNEARYTLGTVLLSYMDETTPAPERQ